MKLLIILKKELLDQVRDRRMIIAALLMPAVIVPLLLFFMTLEPSKGDVGSKVRIIIEKEAVQLQNLIRESINGIQFIQSNAPTETIRDGNAELGIEFIQEGDEYKGFTLYYDPARRISEFTYVRINSLLRSYFSASEPREDALSVQSIPVRSEQKNSSLLTLSIILPVFLMVFSASTTMSSVIDMSAGEKERSTIETLLSSNISRRAIIMGKTLAASVVGITAVAALLGGLMLSSWFFPKITGGVSLLEISSPASIALMGIIMLFCVLLFSAVGMSIGLYAKSIKEGTILTLPVIVLASALSSGLIAGDPYLIDPIFLTIPIANASFVIRSILYGSGSPSAFMISIIINSMYAGLFFLISTYLLKRETVINRS
ncbi:MAG: ABC transporter permease subunit [Spirochaetia bacterium]|nr:ABC transporter permease subunit [Spirochaetia bacterium]